MVLSLANEQSTSTCDNMISPEMKGMKNIMGGANEFCPTRKCGLGRNGCKETWYLIRDLKDELTFSEHRGGYQDASGRGDTVGKGLALCSWQ